MVHIYPTHNDAQSAYIIIIFYPGFSVGNLVTHSAFQGIYSCRVSVYYTWVERDNSG